MKQKWYILIISLLSCVTVYAQDNNPLWVIDNLSLTLQESNGEDGIIVKTNDLFNIPDNWVGGNIEFKFELRKARPAEEGEDSIQPTKIWYKLNGENAAYLDFQAEFKLKVGKDTTWEASKIINVSINDFITGKDNVFSVSLFEKGTYEKIKESIHVWPLPKEPNLIPNSDKTFEDKEIVLTIDDNVTDGLIAEYSINDISVNRKKNTYNAEKIGDKEKDFKTYTLGYKYKYGDKTWMDGSILPVQVTVYHLPVYTPVIVVNDDPNDTHISQKNASIDLVVMPTDKIEFKYNSRFGYNINTSLSDNLNDMSPFIASKTGTHTVTIRNSINKDVYDEQVLTYNITVRSQPEVLFHHIKENGESFLFVPEDDVRVSVDLKNNYDDLKWSYKWFIDKETTPSGTGQEFIIPSSKLTVSDKVIRVDVICTRGDFNRKYVSKSLAHTIKVLSLPKAIIGGDYEGEIITCDSQQVNVTITPEGGYSEGYIFRIEPKDGTNYGKSDKSEGTEYNIRYTNNSESVVNSTFEFTGENIIPQELSTTGKEEKRIVDGVDSKTFKAQIYPHPKVQFGLRLLDDYFYKSEITQKIDTVYEMPSYWTFEWKLDNNDIEPERVTGKYNYYDIIPDGGDSPKVNHILKVIAINSYKGKIWAKRELSHKFTAWHRAQLEGIELMHEGTSNNNIYQGHKFQMSSLQKYGYPKGWEYSWKRVGSKEIISADSTDTFDAKFFGTETEGSDVQTYKLEVKNYIPELSEEPFYDEKSRDITVWRKAENYKEGADASILSITDTENGAIINNRIREGRVLRLQVPKAQYGFENQWNYDWDLSGEKGENSNNIIFTVPSINGNGEAMLSESKTFWLEISNIGPNGVAWEKNEISKPYTIYRKPRTPLSLVPKGNGTSRTLIATMAISDDQLKNNDYYLCFGCQETNGNVTLIGEPQKQEGPGQTRFSMQIPQERWNDKSNLCVFALWHYGDGTWITSGLRFINDEKEDWDGSDYSGSGKYSGTTRGGDTTDITSIKRQQENMRYVYGLEGASRSNLRHGLNIVRNVDGSVHKVVMK